MRNFALLVAGSLVLAGFTTPAMAHPDDYGYGGYETRHDEQHDRLDQRHDDGHEYLDEVHREAHEEGLSPWEHWQLHRDLDREHARQHRRLDRIHRWQHWNNEGDPYYRGGWSGY